MNDNNPATYTFGPLSLRVSGLGVYFGGPKLEAKVAALSPEQLREANRAALGDSSGRLIVFASATAT